jgi:thymidylate synthase ThyX
MSDIIPRVFPVATTSLHAGLDAYLRSIGAIDMEEKPDWKTDAPSHGEELIEVAGRLCYRSWFPYDPDRPLCTNANVGQIREGNAKYISNLIKSAHGSVLECVNISMIFQNVSRVFTHELVRHRAGMAYCISGDTEIWSASKLNGMYNGVKKKWRIADIFENCKTSHGRSRLRLMEVRCFDGIRFVKAKIRNVFQSGIKELFEITLSDGKKIKSSLDHIFLTKDGWKSLNMLQVEEPIAVNGLRDQKEYSGEKHHSWKGDDASDQAGRLRAWKLYDTIGERCEICGSSDLFFRIERHHKDGNTKNNEQDNIQYLCSSCHGRLHIRKTGSPNILTVAWSPIHSIECCGSEMTYDLSIMHPAHNFVANGIVTHNSQESMRFVRMESVPYWKTPLLRDQNLEFQMEFEMAIEQIEGSVQRLIRACGLEGIRDFGTKKALTSLIRRIIPMGVCTTIMATGNLRSWRHIMGMRTAGAAEEEIRNVMDQVGHILKGEYPNVFADMIRQDDGQWILEKEKV